MVYSMIHVRAKFGIIVGMASANKRGRYIVTPSLIGWALSHSDSWK